MMSSEWLRPASFLSRISTQRPCPALISESAKRCSLTDHASPQNGNYTSSFDPTLGNTCPGKGITKDGIRWFHHASSGRINMTISIDFFGFKTKHAFLRLRLLKKNLRLSSNAFEGGSDCKAQLPLGFYWYSSCIFCAETCRGCHHSTAAYIMATSCSILSLSLSLCHFDARLYFIVTLVQCLCHAQFGKAG